MEEVLDKCSLWAKSRSCVKVSNNADQSSASSSVDSCNAVINEDLPASEDTDLEFDTAWMPNLEVRRTFVCLVPRCDSSASAATA